jgi:Glycosyl transferases group 1
LTTDETVSCALLTCFRNDWAAALTIAAPGLRIVTLAPARLGLAQMPNPFALAEVEAADAVLVTGYWLDWLRGAAPTHAERAIAALERCGRVVIGIDGTDHFELGMTPRDLARFPLTLKFQGLFRDRDLYNYEVGPRYPDAIWSAKLRPRAERYRDADLERLRLSVPCTMLDLPGVRRVARRLEEGDARTVAGGIDRGGRTARAIAETAFSSALRVAPVSGRTADVHLVATMTHVQRLEATRRLQGFSGARGLNLPPVVFPPDAGDEATAVRARLGTEAAALQRPYVGRARYVAEMARHRIVVAPTGYGELGQRHGWALRTGAALVCQDLAHVRMMYPLHDRENVLFCRPDLADLADRVDELLADEPLRRRIAGQGRRSFHRWERRWREQLELGIAAPVRSALGRPASGEAQVS